ncbi:MAG: mtDNA inheritance, partitioning of the mitochondrial organelle [Pycnora praestabilis]|nr:MAG: mtDNA inheritance, partitioning of the mitochondrial organelle [Pycnora praestabilis]
MHEIVTLQLGHRSNYLATHFWNTQESYFTYSASEESPVDHDINFRPGIGSDGSETFTPRTLIYDLKGGFGTLRKINALYDMQEEQGIPKGLWDGNTAVQRQATINQNEYQRSLDEGLPPAPLSTETVRYWSDFNRVFYHPRSIVQLNDYELNSSLMPFENWDTGEELFSALDKEHDLLDRDLRPFAEECDQLQGIQIFTEADSAWGGFGARYLDRIRDEFGKTCIWVWGLEDGARNLREKHLQKTINTARSYQDISSQASLYVPILDPPAKLPSYVSLDRSSDWHTSAVLGTGMETMTISSRLKSQDGIRKTLREIEGALNINGNQKIANLQMSVMDLEALDDDHEKENHLGQNDLRIRGQEHANTMNIQQRHELHSTNASLAALDMDLNPGLSPRHQGRVRKPHTFGTAIINRGNNFSQLTHIGSDGQSRNQRRLVGIPVIETFNTSLLFPLLDSFPLIFGTEAHRPNSVAVRTSLSTTSAVAVRIKQIETVVSRAVRLDEREALSNSLGELIEAYEDGWDSGSDEDDD